jgi:hypothetical protein
MAPADVLTSAGEFCTRRGTFPNAGARERHLVIRELFESHKGFWGWTFREAGANLVAEGAMTEARYNELSEGMRIADDDPSTLVAHARMHRPARARRCQRSEGSGRSVP